MNFEAFKQKTLEIFALNTMLPTPNDEQIEKLFVLTDIMLEVNKSMNLTAITEESAVILKHYADSVSISDLIPEGASVIDVGCGAGFPTLPLAIFRPDVKILGLDSTSKRIEYVKGTASKLGLSNVSAISGRAEELGRDAEFREKFDVATARAVAALPILCEICIPFVKLGGKFVAMKASHGVEESISAANAIDLCCGRIAVQKEIGLTANGSDFEKRL
ncbi:MAG: 16S rRNA (guanine(527)-N(7))-methyltransferase RsmG, partial [Clostridia bacterium]|nr:16S rRNA (guanine(527)-N(7))-methyltransferase RsmG [Clostridia bacterium]